MRAARPGVNAEFMQQSAATQPRVAALAVPNFRLYVSGQSLSLIGTWVRRYRLQLEPDGYEAFLSGQAP
jgi:hypothetical protein